MIVLCGPAQFCSGTVGAGQPHLPDSQISSQLAIKCGGEVMGNDFPALGVTWASVAYLSYLIKFIQNHHTSLAHSADWHTATVLTHHPAHRRQNKNNYATGKQDST